MPQEAVPQDSASREDAPSLSLEHRMLVRCSAAFALTANGQVNGQAGALRYPAMAERGQEFFVRASAQVMDEAELDRAQISAALSAEAQQLRDNGTIDDVMPACLGLLPAE
ncbi:hypothetical protein AAV99_05565 [Aurantiacibacter marinus]|uniref:Uncharacterized protein n=1 Tax=Aurantiacibacter marinus TaxID=874156 RepID=A0A0H0XTE9_9SPHN|nr:hypothetical protein AAV99_05565 [Aurantiacibacter marinus]